MVECYLDTVVVTGSSPVPRNCFSKIDRGGVCSVLLFLCSFYPSMVLSKGSGPEKVALFGKSGITHSAIELSRLVIQAALGEAFCQQTFAKRRLVMPYEK